MVGVSRGVDVRQVAIYTWPFVVYILAVAGWGEAAGFDD